MFDVYCHFWYVPRKSKVVPSANFTDTAVGIVFIYEYSQPDALVRNAVAIYDFGLPYQSISFSLNVILTLMIVIRLALHSKNIRNAMGTQAGASGLYNAIITMLIESFALYAVIALLYFVTWVVDDSSQFIFNPIIPEVQVRVILHPHSAPQSRDIIT